jgi:hypothetical protein
MVVWRVWESAGSLWMLRSVRGGKFGRVGVKADENSASEIVCIGYIEVQSGLILRRSGFAKDL